MDGSVRGVSEQNTVLSLPPFLILCEGHFFLLQDSSIQSHWVLSSLLKKELFENMVIVVTCES